MSPEAFPFIASLGCSISVTVAGKCPLRHRRITIYITGQKCGCGLFRSTCSFVQNTPRPPYLRLNPTLILLTKIKVLPLYYPFPSLTIYSHPHVTTNAYSPSSSFSIKDQSRITSHRHE
jgi:hypothetical protein